MARCRKCGLSFDPQPGSQGMYCSRDCTNADKRGKVGRKGRFENLGLGPRVPLAALKTGSWEEKHL
jgi:hypothetical protein